MRSLAGTCTSIWNGRLLDTRISSHLVSCRALRFSLGCVPKVPLGMWQPAKYLCCEEDLLKSMLTSGLPAQV